MTTIHGDLILYALILVGGRGQRLQPLTDNIPKSMVPINGRPIVEYQVGWMRSQGVTDVVFLTGYLGHQIEEHFGDGAQFGVNAHYSHEDTPLGRGGAIRKGLSMVTDGVSPVLVTNGDNITDLDLNLLHRRHKQSGALATLMLTRFPSPFGVVDVGDDNLIVEFREKGLLPFWINAGVYLFDRSIESLLPENGDHEDSTFPDLARKRQLAALRSEAMLLTVDNAKDLDEVSGRLIDWSPG
jgi:NDP-sugar pyrophosphorylase family protein